MTQPQMQLLVCPTCGSVRAPLKDVVVVQPKNGLVVANAGVQTTPCLVCELRVYMVTHEHADGDYDGKITLNDEPVDIQAL